MTIRQIWLNLGALGLLIALLGLVYWQYTGPRAVPGLIEDVQSDDAQAQLFAAMHLGEIGLAAKAAVPALMSMAAASPNSYAASTAAGALPTIDLSAARQVMAAWMPKLQDPDPQIRRDAASVLGAIGPVAKPAVRTILGILDDPDTLVRNRAVRALGNIGIPADMVVPGLLDALRDPEWTVRQAAVSQFSFSGFSSPESLTVLRDLTKDPNQTVARSAQSAVATAERSIQASVYSMTLSQKTNRPYQLLQLAKLGPRAAEALSSISPLLASAQPLERYLAACALGEIGTAAMASVPALQQVLHDTDPVVREAAAEALRAINRDKVPTP